MLARTTPPAVPADCALSTPLAELGAIYDRIEREQATWQAVTPWRCPEGCGSCCEHFEPDVLEIEALWLAAWVMQQDEAAAGTASSEAEQLLERNSERDGCPLARDEGPWFCSVYGGRPLVCRLFAYSGDRGKDGRARFRPCSRLVEPGKSSPSIGEEELLARFGQLPPLMGNLAGLSDSLLPGNTERRPLRQALTTALSKLRMLKRYSSIIPFPVNHGGHDGDNDNPGGSTPPMPTAV